ncbi:MAG: hypothetical protein P1V51_14815 [Deltaproteobacteria bacterium]|nr:hypothetical protein [Deltaproteobacteria bacterium]
MTTAALVFSLVIVLQGAVGLLSPTLHLELARLLLRPGRLQLAAGYRLAMGVVFVLAAPASRAPTLLLILGIVVLVSGVVAALVGTARYGRVIKAWAAGPPGLVRLQGAVTAAVGLLLAYAFTG